MFALLSSFLEMPFTDEEAIHSLAAIHLGEQYVMKSERATKALRLLSCAFVSDPERAFIIRKSGKTDCSKKASELEQIHLTYGRQGHYWSELWPTSLNDKELALCDEQGFLFEESVEPFAELADLHPPLHEFSFGSPRWMKKRRMFMPFRLPIFLPSSTPLIRSIQVGIAGKHYPKEVLYWMGYLYRYWVYYRYRNSKSLYRLMPEYVTLYPAYFAYHTMDPKTAIENLEEDYLDAHPEEKEKEANLCADFFRTLQELRSASKPIRSPLICS
jgi:hypothetical protein